MSQRSSAKPYLYKQFNPNQAFAINLFRLYYALFSQCRSCDSRCGHTRVFSKASNGKTIGLGSLRVLILFMFAVTQR